MRLEQVVSVLLLNRSSSGDDDMESRTPGIQAALVFCLLLIASGCGSDKDDCGRTKDQQTGVRVCSFVASPTDSESVTLKNYGTTEATLDGYSLWDANANSKGTGQKGFTSADIIPANGTKTFTELPFGINDSGETLYLKDGAGNVVDQESN